MYKIYLSIGLIFGLTALSIVVDNPEQAFNREPAQSRLDTREAEQSMIDDIKRQLADKKAKKEAEAIKNKEKNLKKDKTSK